MRRAALVTSFIVVLGLFVGGPAAADPMCGETIHASVKLTHDVGPCSSGGLTIGADHIVLNLNGFKILGEAGPGDGNGVTASSTTGTVIENGTIADFDEGVSLEGGSGTRLSRVDLLGNRGDGVTTGDGLVAFSGSSGITITHCLFEGNGPITGAQFSPTVTNVTITRTTFRDNEGDGLELLAGGTNVVKKVRAEGNSGIGLNIGGTRIEVVSNTANENGFASGGVGIFVFASSGPVARNVANGNGGDGIVVSLASADLHLSRNKAKRDGQVTTAAFGLVDDNPSCGTDVWRHNKGTRNQSCIH